MCIWPLLHALGAVQGDRSMCGHPAPWTSSNPGSPSKLLTSGYIVGSDDITSSELPRHHNHLDHLIAILERQQLVWLHDLVSLFSINIAISSRRNIRSGSLLHSIQHCWTATRRQSNLPVTNGVMPIERLWILPRKCNCLNGRWRGSHSSLSTETTVVTFRLWFETLRYFLVLILKLDVFTKHEVQHDSSQFANCGYLQKRPACSITSY